MYSRSSGAQDRSWDQKQRREYLLDENGQRIKDDAGHDKFNAVPTTDWGSPETLEFWRKKWAELCNAKFEEKGMAERIDHRSYERQGIHQIPTIHEGPAVRAMERRGIRTEKGDINRWVKATNKMMDLVQEHLDSLTDWIGLLPSSADLHDRGQSGEGDAGTLQCGIQGHPARVKRKEADYFQPEEMEDILKALQKVPLKWKAMTYILIDTGCRRGELMGLQWNCVDLDKGIILIKQALLYTKEKGVFLGNTKTSRPRAVCIAPETVAVLKQYKTEQLRNKILHADIWQDTGYVFTKDDGTAMHPDSITDWLNKFSEEYDLPHIHPHAFRHTAASTMISNGVDIVTTAAELGHATATTTANIYAHQMAKARAEAGGVRAGVFASLRQA